MTTTRKNRAKRRKAVPAQYPMDDIYDSIDLSALLKHRRQIAVIWGTDDVRELRPDFTHDQAWEVLQLCDRRGDCELGLTWALIDLAADDLFSRPSDDEEEANA